MVHSALGPISLPQKPGSRESHAGLAGVAHPTAELSSAWGAHLLLQLKPFMHYPAQHFLPTDLQPRR